MRHNVRVLGEGSRVPRRTRDCTKKGFPEDLKSSKMFHLFCAGRAVHKVNAGSHHS